MFGEAMQTGDLPPLRSLLPLAAVLLRSRSPRAPPNRPKGRLQHQHFRRILQGHRIKSSSAPSEAGRTKSERESVPPEVLRRVVGWPRLGSQADRAS
jgi:hypothetical protein